MSGSTLKGTGFVFLNFTSLLSVGLVPCSRLPSSATLSRRQLSPRLLAESQVYVIASQNAGPHHSYIAVDDEHLSVRSGLAIAR